MMCIYIYIYVYTHHKYRRLRSSLTACHKEIVTRLPFAARKPTLL